MIDNPFVAALLMQAAEHRLRAESYRSQKLNEGNHRFGGWLGDLLIGMNDDLEKRARAQDGLAEVYEGFARKILGEEYWVRWNWVSKDSYLMGPVGLLDPRGELHWDHQPIDWSMALWTRFPHMLPSPLVHLPLIFTGV